MSGFRLSGFRVLICLLVFLLVTKLQAQEAGPADQYQLQLEKYWEQSRAADRQSVETDRQLKLSGDQLERTASQIDIADELIERQKRQMDRWDLILSRHEKLLDSMESRVHSVPAN